MENLRVSTITAIGRIFNNKVDLYKIFTSIDPNKVIRYIKFGEFEKGVLEKRKKIKKDFFNQMTIHIYDGKKKNDGKINVKLFNNGRIQITGLILIEQGQFVIDILHEHLKNNKDIDIINKDSIKLDIVLINSDFDFGKPIDRELLYNYLLDQDIYVTYESCIYPGVNIKYYYLNNNISGICNCTNQCDGKGDGITTCKKVTIAVFHSGKVIITGGQSFDQIVKSYNFINIILNKLFNKN